MKKLDSKLIIEAASKKPRKSKVSFTVDTEIYEEFQKICEENDSYCSRIITVLMQNFTEEFKK